MNTQLKPEMIEALQVLRTTAEAQQMKLVHRGIKPTWTNFKKTQYFKNLKKKYSKETIDVFKRLWLLK